MAINALISFNGTEITEHGRTYNDSIVMNNNDIELANGNSRRFYKPSKKSFKFSWFWYVIFIFFLYLLTVFYVM